MHMGTMTMVTAIMIAVTMVDRRLPVTEAGE
jgi:hypothetical protein